MKVFLLYSVRHSSLWHCKVQSGKQEQIKNISVSKMKKIKNSQPQTKFTGSYKKKKECTFKDYCKTD